MNDTKILSVRRFGSSVRGDADSLSDVDVICILDSASDTNKKDAAEQLSVLGEVSLSFYGKKRISEMFSQGHLFAWHLYKESMPVEGFTSNDLIDELPPPSPYQDAREDIRSLIELGGSIPNNLHLCQQNATYEAGLLYVWTRNVAISLSWFSSLGLNFSCFAPYFLGSEFKEFPIDRSCFGEYRRARLASTRGLNARAIDVNSLIKDSECSLFWARECLRTIGYEEEKIS